jgi:hypothetical protein
VSSEKFFEDRPGFSVLPRLQSCQYVDAAKLTGVESHVPIQLPQHDLVEQFRGEGHAYQIIQLRRELRLVFVPEQELGIRWL